MNIKEFIKNNKGLQVKKYNPKEEGCIYFICNKQGTILYVGATCNISSRIATHKQAVQFANKDFYFFSYPARSCLLKEASLIESICPKYNKIHNNKGPVISNKYHSLKVGLKKRGLTQSAVAKKLGVTRQAISLVVNGQGGSSELYKKIEQFIL